jgi:hypothetical protein
MLKIAMRTLFVGALTPRITTILTRLGQKGFGSYAVESLGQAREAVESSSFELAIALERLDDGQGYELTELVTRRGGSLFVGVETSQDYLWLPVVDHGKRVLGASALDYDMLEGELEDVLTHRSACARPVSRWIPPLAPRVSETKRPAHEMSLGNAGDCSSGRAVEQTPTRVPVLAVRSLLRGKAKSARAAAKFRGTGQSDAVFEVVRAKAAVKE